MREPEYQTKMTPEQELEHADAWLTRAFILMKRAEWFEAQRALGKVVSRVRDHCEEELKNSALKETRQDG